MCKEDYLKILEEEAVQSGQELLGEGFIFQQDNDLKHTSLVVKDRLAQLEAEGTLINPIEHVWGHLDRRMKDRKCRNLEELMVELRRGWEELPEDYLKKLVHSMPRQI